MTYEKFAKKQKEILDKAGEYLYKFDLFKFSKKMDEYNLLGDKYLKQFRENASYLLCLYDVAREYSSELKYPDYKDVDFFKGNEWLSKDMFVKDPEKILKYLTDVEWNVEKSLYIPHDNKKHYFIMNYSYKNVNHFCRTTFDPLEESDCKKNRVLNSLRVCTPLNNKNV